MKTLLLATAAFCLLAAGAQAEGPASSATYISSEDWQKVMQLGVPGDPDHTVRAVDIGLDNQMDIAVIRRVPPGGAPIDPAVKKAAAEASARRAAAKAGAAPCGPAAPPAGAKVAPSATYLTHDAVGEVYFITKGDGVMVTGGTMYGGLHEVSEDVGPGCSGKVYGDFHTQNVKVGDIVVVPAGLPHGFASVGSGIEYMNFRVDPKHAIPQGYISPALK